MIVNPAYIFMGGTQSPAALSLWSDGKINTEYEFSRASFNSETNTVTVNNKSGFAKFKNIDCKKFEQLKFSAKSKTFVTVKILVIFYDSQQREIYQTEVTAPKADASAGEFIIQIPTQAKTAGITIEFKNGGNAPADLFNAELS